MKPSHEQIQQAADLLVNRYGISTRLINKLLGNQEDLLSGLIDNNLSNFDRARLLIHQRGTLLFSGHSEDVRYLRRKLLERLDDEVVNTFFEQYCQTSGTTQVHKIRKLSELKWHNGKTWPFQFVTALEFPKVFAGMQKENKMPIMEDIDPFIQPPKLTSFQVELKSKLLEVLNREGDKTRCVVSLPTGGGKTRTAVEAFIEWLQPRFSEGLYLVWIAQSEELCEQAIECIRQMWGSREFFESLRIYRYFGGNEIDLGSLKGGVVVASINQLHQRIEDSHDPAIQEIICNTGAMIIDEAHRAVTPMYQRLFRFAEQIKGPELFPICGLTATPGRSFGQTHFLVETFDSLLFTPTLGEEYQHDPLNYFREHGYLAKPIHITCTTNERIASSSGESEEEFNNRYEKILKELARSENRNRLIINRLREIPKGKQTIVYACTVEHAEMLSTVMNYFNRPSVVISAKTPRHYRRAAVEQFRAGKLDFIFNFGVLTTGFDAPKTEFIVLCRPTFSEVLYEQIVGRGLRGPKFGGTEYCTIIDFSDNFERFGEQLAYKRFDSFWVEYREEAYEYCDR